MARPAFDTVDAYLAAQPPAARAALERVRALLHEAMPGAEEGISYAIPVLRLNGAYALYFAGFKHHYAIYPLTEAVRALGDEVTARSAGQGTVRFELSEPVPEDLIRRIGAARAAEIAAAPPKRSRSRKPAGPPG